MIHQLTLSNGFTLLGEVLPHFRSVSFSFWTGLGSVWDPVGKYGMAAFVCEMMLRGAGDLSNRQFLEAIDRIGIDRTESLTASTLEFRASMLAENLEAALDLYADLLRRPVLPREQMEDGRQVLLQEISFCEDNPEGRLGQVMSERFFGPAWGHDEDGNREGIESISWEEVRAQYDALMMPNQCVLAVAGSFDWEKTRKRSGVCSGTGSQKRNRNFRRTRRGASRCTLRSTRRRRTSSSAGRSRLCWSPTGGRSGPGSAFWAAA